MTWSAPVQISIAIYMLWRLMGVAVLAGLAVMILIIPINGVIATISRKLQVSYVRQCICVINFLFSFLFRNKTVLLFQLLSFYL